LLGCIPFVLVMQWDGSNGKHEHAVHDALMALLSVAVPVLAARLRGSDLGRFVLLGWALGATGIVVAYWRVLQENSSPLQGVPNVLLAMAALAAVALVRSLWRPRATSVPPPAEGDPAPGIEES
jgi:drug/metabolite transporter (DMT)-like permease